MSQNLVAISGVSIGDIDVSGQVARTSDRVESFAFSLPLVLFGAMGAGGTVIDGLVGGHGLSVSDVIDVHWLDPTTSEPKCRRGIVVDTANTNDIVFDETPAGEGDSYPAEDTVLTVDIQETDTNLTFTGNNIKMIGVSCDVRSFLSIRGSGGELQGVKLGAGESWFWDYLGNITNPFVGATITILRASSGDKDNIGTMKMAVGYDL